MRTTGRLVVAGLWVASALAFADPNDFRIRALGNPTNVATANANFAAFSKEFAAALTSSNLMPPGTLGHAGFNIAAELSVVSLETQELTDPSQAPAAGKFYIPTEKQAFASRGPLLIPSLHVRKGLPFSFELGMKASYIDKSNLAAATAELRWAVNEGFAYLPDICVRGYLMKLFGTQDFDLGAGGLDLSVGKRFAIGGMITLTPYVGWNLVFVSAGSSTIDFNPGRTYEESVATQNAQLRNDTGVYRTLAAGENSHNRFYGGFRFVGGVIQLGAELSYSGLGQIEYPTGKQALPAVTAFNATAALDF